MATEYGVDYAWDRPDPKKLRTAGKTFAIRYLSYNTTGKNVTRAECEALWGAGLSVVLNWENRKDDYTDGRAGGQRNAAEAVRQAHVLGWPEDRPIYFSIDSDVSGRASVTRPYLLGLNDVMPVGRIGLYGGVDAIDYAYGSTFAKWYWQTKAWSHGIWRGYADLWQTDVGVTWQGWDVDWDTALTKDFGQWDGSMLTDAQQAEMYAGVKDLRYAFFTSDAAGRPTGCVSQRIQDIQARIGTGGITQDMLDQAMAAGIAANLDAISDAVADKLSKRLES